MKRILSALAIASLIVAASQAQLIVNEDLGVLGEGTVSLIGTTDGAGDEATYYDGVSNPLGVWGEDYVYQFTTTEEWTYQVSTNAITGDPDFFLLDSLSTFVDGGGVTAASGALQADFLDGTPPDFGDELTLPAGTYYLSIDSWNTAPISTWDATLALSGPPTVSCFGPVILDAGFYDRDAGGTADHPYGIQEFTVDTDGVYTINTAWDGFDGYLYLFDSPFAEDDSTNIAFDDDFNGTAESQIDSVSLLAGQTYYLVSTTFGGEAGVTDLASLKTTISGPGTAALVPEPSSLSLVLVGFLALALRRRK